MTSEVIIDRSHPDYLRERIATLERQLSDLRAALEGRWISVGTALPEKNPKRFMTTNTVIVETTEGVYAAQFHTGNGFFYEVGGVAETGLRMASTPEVKPHHNRNRLSSEPYAKAIRWQPLPPAPKEK